MNRKLFLLVIVLLAAVVLPARWAAAQDAPRVMASPAPRAALSPDAFEPNNTLAAAAQIWLLADPGITFDYAYEEATIAPAGDVDYYKIITSSGLQTTIILAVPEGNPMRLELAALDAAGNVLAEDVTCNPANDYVVLDQPMAAADFLYLRVRPCPGQGSLTEVYGLYVDPGSDRYEVEPNDSRATAQRLGDNPYFGSEPSGSIATAGDRDFYQYDGRRGEAIHVQVDSYTGAPDDLQPRVALMDVDGNILASGVGDPGWPYSVEFDVILPADGDYYVRIIPEVGVGDYSLNMYPASFEEIEPNDTPAEAMSIGFGGDNYGWVAGSDVDTYKFDGRAGDWMMVVDAFSCYTYDYYPFHSTVRGPDGALVTTALNTPFQLPVDGTYTVTLTPPDPDEGGYYLMNIARRLGNEPNDTPATATPIAYGQEIHELQSPENDVDYYAFTGRMGDVIRVTAGGPMAPWVGLIGPSGLLLDAGSQGENYTEAHYALPADGTYYVGVDSMNHCALDWGYGGGPYVLTLERDGSLYVSSSQTGLGGNSAIAPADIAARNPANGQWEIVFDGSDVGLTSKQNVNAFEFMSDGSLLIALGKPQNVPGISGKVKPNDVVRFVPSNLGATTAGTWSMYLKGSTVGLTTSGEKIDAIQNVFCGYECQYDLITVSLSGSGSVAGTTGGTLAVKDEDLIRYDAYTGKWEFILDGSIERYGQYDPLGLGAEDVNAATELPGSTDWYTPHGVALLSLTNGFNLAGLSGGAKDVVGWEYFYWGSPYGGDFYEIDYPGPWKAFTNLMGKTIDGLAVGPAWRQ